MTTEAKDPAFPSKYTSGMTFRDWLAGQALANPVLCTGTAPEYTLNAWFGGRGGIRREEIASRQAYDYADAMLAARGT